MVFNQADELMGGLEAAPFEFGLPSQPELQHAALVGVVPQMTERLFEQMRFEKLRTGGQDIVERLSRLSPNTRPSGHQDELLARERLLEAPQGLGELGLSDVIESFQKVLDHMELVVDDLDSGAVLGEAVTKGF